MPTKKAKTKAKPKRIAGLTVHGIGKMSARQRRNIAGWLRKQAREFESNGDEYTTGRYRASFNYW